jgi:hypothetical protein
VKPRILLLSAVLCTLALTAVTPPVNAGGITVSAVDCHPVGVSQESLLHTWEGVQRTLKAPPGPFFISCSVPRSPLTTFGQSAVFRLTGYIYNGATMPCTLTSYDYTGVLLGSATVSLTAPPVQQWTRVVQEVSLPDGQLPYWAYTSLVCQQPGDPAVGAWLSSVTSQADSATGTNINTHTTQCHATNPDSMDLIIHDATGVRTGPDVNAPQAITCSVPRSPLADPSHSFGFYVDGDNLGGAATICWITSYDYTGNYLGGTAFSTASPKYDQFLSLPAAQLSWWAYTSLTCWLPEKGRGVLRGVTSMQ